MPTWPVPRWLVCIGKMGQQRLQEGRHTSLVCYRGARKILRTGCPALASSFSNYGIRPKCCSLTCKDRFDFSLAISLMTALVDRLQQELEQKAAMFSIPKRETLTVEFKSDLGPLPDRELVAAAVCLANTEGGEIYLGVEKDGRRTGVHRNHQNMTGLSALIGNRTNPPLSVRVEASEFHGVLIARIVVPKSQRPVATSEGLLQRRRLLADGTPECVPFYPHEIIQRQADLGLLDYSAFPVPGATVDDFDPLEREWLRQTVERYGGDRSLLALRDQELEGALGFVTQENGQRLPRTHGRIEGKEAAELCRISEYQASRLLRKLRFEKKLSQRGKGRGVYYVLA